MKARWFVLPLVLGLGLVLACIGLLSIGGARSVAEADMAASETDLNPGGTAYEINIDDHGFLWISDNEADEIWQVDPVGQVYTIYHGINSPSDARRDAAGAVWWAEAGSNRLGRLSPPDEVVTLWEVPGAEKLFGTQVDAAGQIWATDFFHPHLYRFDLSSTQLCTYTIPSDGASDYLTAQAEDIWLGDWKNDRIYKLTPALNLFTQWQLPADGYPEGLAFDGSGNLWWADSELGEVARLEPQSDRLTRFDPPTGGSPEMITILGEQVWYTEDSNGTVGMLDPATVTGTSFTLDQITIPATSTCGIQGPGTTTPVTTTTGLASWTQRIYPSVVDAGGWTIYELPEGAFPWGIAASGRNVWFVDNGRQVLGRLSFGVDVTACKLQDADGDLTTTEDQSPVAGWTVYLTVDDTRQSPGQLTGGDGCYTWSSLEVGVSYGVEEELPDGWTALTPSSHNFGQANSGEAYSFTFVNFESQNVIYLPLVMR